MATLNPPFSTAAVDVPEGLVDRYVEAGWVHASAKPERSETPDETWKVADLRSFAASNHIDLGDATKKADILTAIATAEDADTADAAEADTADAGVGEADTPDDK